MTVRFSFDNSYARLPERFYARLDPTPVAAPALVRVNADLARELGLDPEALTSTEGLSVLSGNAVPEGASPIAQAYAGHQFGGWVPQLGDGRAILLGEVTDRQGVRRDIQLKGAGRTPFSRMGDGRAWLGPVLREYIVSEAMHALGIPTTRALAAVATGETILRERPLPGAVLTRVASSHIRVGTFQYFAARNDVDGLQQLFDHVVARHYPEVGTPLDLLTAVIERQAELVAAWMAVGFIHGVMNTDNTSVAGETIDYGPCAFLDTYKAEKVFSSIDQFGRYAFVRQPDVLVWNLAQFATTLLPLMGEDRNTSIDAATEAVHAFPDKFRAAWLARFRAKLGLSTEEDGDADLVQTLLARMETLHADFTNTFRALGTEKARNEFMDPVGFDAWEHDWLTRLSREGATKDAARARLVSANPVIIPRNHRIEEAIASAVEGDFAPFHRLTEALMRPFDPAAGSDDLRQPPAPDELVRQTFCGT